MQIVIGLGNPGSEYKNTRHNTGFFAVDELAKSQGGAWSFKKKFQAEVCEIAGWLLVKPQTFVNKSGEAVLSIMNYYKLLPKTLGFLIKKETDLSRALVVVHDELDIETGKYKISAGSRSAGHRGVQSIIDSVKTKNFKRIRIGIKTPALEKIPADKFVLQKFSPEEMKAVSQSVKDALSQEFHFFKK